VNGKHYGQLLSVAIADFLFKQYFTSTSYCVAVVWQVFGFALFSSLPASEKKSSLESMMVVAFKKI